MACTVAHSIATGRSITGIKLETEATSGTSIKLESEASSSVAIVKLETIVLFQMQTRVVAKQRFYGENRKLNRPTLYDFTGKVFSLGFFATNGKLLCRLLQLLLFNCCLD